MAENLNTTNLSRRAALTARWRRFQQCPPSLPLFQTMTAQWLALYRAFCEAESHVCPAINATDEAEAVAKLEYPKRPRAGRKAWEAQCAEIDCRYDLPTLRAAEEAAWAASRAAEHAIVDKPANSIAGIAVKLA